MKNYLVKLLSILILFCVDNACGQSNVSAAHYKNGDKALRLFLLTSFDEARKKNQLDVCEISVTFAKFTIDKAGNVEDIAITGNEASPKIFGGMLTAIIKETSGLWVPETIAGKAVKSRPFILPLIYQMEAGCFVNGRSVIASNGTDNALLGFINDFHDPDNPNQLDCIFLKPLNVFSQN